MQFCNPYYTQLSFCFALLLLLPNIIKIGQSSLSRTIMWPFWIEF